MRLRCMLQSNFDVFQILLFDQRGAVVEDQNNFATGDVFGEGF
uniref:Uncharacterized protein n=1 Tax=Peronospora matthiolae TaxID=2874970 RepID=A0AAV1UKD0_9STRA